MGILSLVKFSHSKEDTLELMYVDLGAHSLKNYD